MMLELHVIIMVRVCGPVWVLVLLDIVSMYIRVDKPALLWKLLSWKEMGNPSKAENGCTLIRQQAK